MYAPLKVTTDYTLLKSLIKIEDLMSFLKKENIKACAICDEFLFGAMHFYQSCKANGIKPIIGLSITLNELPIYLYAKNYNGYKNLIQIHSLKQKEEMSVARLRLYYKDIVVIIPFTSHSLYESLLFFEDLYVGFKNEYEKKSAKVLTDHIVFVNDIRAFYVDDLKYLEYLDMMRKEEKKDYSYQYYLKTVLVDEKEIEDFVDLFDLEMPDDKRYIPIYHPNIDSYVYLSSLAQKGLAKRLGDVIPAVYQKRLQYELDVIKKMGYVDYFLIVYDYVLYAKKNNIYVGPGRGSAAGSLVSYAIGIIEIDPLKYDLLFERFLNPARITMPDIDIDFDASKRSQVINYVKEKYGVLNVAPGITFASLKSKLVLRELGKLLHIDTLLLDRFLSEIDGSKTLEENLLNMKIKQYLERYKELMHLYTISKKLEGLKRNVSTHAAGVVISNVPLEEVIPVFYNNGEMLTGFSMDYLENLGLLKMDFLGVKNLTTIANVLEKIDRKHLYDIPLDDQRVYALFTAGKTEGVFQFETPLMRSLIMRFKPTSFDDLIAAVAIGRPGPKGHAEEYRKRKNGEEAITYLHPDLEPILKSTYGVLLYQEQIIAILGVIGGYSYAEADLIRRAISKKKEAVLIKGKEDFVLRAVKRGYEKSLAQHLYDQILKFANYGFNKAHSVAYALIAYQMAYLKVYYPTYFVTELLNMSSGNKDALYFRYLKQKGIRLFKPSVNNQKIQYEYLDQKLIMPLSVIKNINDDIALEILKNKGSGYVDLFDFVLKNKKIVNEGLLNILIKAGAMDVFMQTRQSLIKMIPSALNYAEIASDMPELVEKPTIVVYPEYDDALLREMELESFGFYITNHPASKYKSEHSIMLEKKEKYLFKKVEVVCMIEQIRTIKTKKQEEMAFFMGSDESGECDFTVFPNKVELLKNIKVRDVVRVVGEISKRFDKISIIVNNISKLEG